MMRDALIAELAIVVAVLWLPPLSELFSFLVRRRRGAPMIATKKPRLLFFVPAHDEELMIGNCVRALQAMDYPASYRRVVVIADNCSDSTAKIARDAGAEVFERSDLDARGKPHALAWALGQVDLKEWDACVIIDADSIVAPSFGLGVAEIAPVNDIIFQPNNVVLNEFETWLTRLGGLLGRCRFEVTYPLKTAAGLNCPISNGMGFGANILRRDGWRSFSITEDTELYAIYTEAGVQIRHAGAATVYSQEASSLGQGGTQRRRWLAGRIHIMREWVPRLLRSPRIGWRQKLDAVVELGLSGPVLHLLSVLLVLVEAVWLVGGRAGAAIGVLSVLSLSALTITVTGALVKHPQPWRTLASFALLPLYAVWRVVILVGTAVTLGDKTWHRTARTPAPVSGSLPLTEQRG